jgi:hypothetical protein
MMEGIAFLWLPWPPAAIAKAPPHTAGMPSVTGERLRDIMETLNRNVPDDTDTGTIPGNVDPARVEALTVAVEELLYHPEPLRADAVPQGLAKSDVVTFRTLASPLLHRGADHPRRRGGNSCNHVRFKELLHKSAI